MGSAPSKALKLRKACQVRQRRFNQYSPGVIDEALSLARTARLKMPATVSVADTLAWIYYHQGLLRRDRRATAGRSSENA